MTIQEILEAHHEWDVDIDYDGSQDAVTCPCGWRELLGLHAGAQHRAHVAEVLNKHMQERCYEAWSAGWHDSHYQHTAHNEHRGHAHPEVAYSNPYRKDATNGR